LRIETQTYYGLKRPDAYEEDQIARSTSKRTSRKSLSFYTPVAEALLAASGMKNQESSTFSMICMGTRNNGERVWFRSLMKTQNVFSLDIADNRFKEGEKWVASPMPGADFAEFLKFDHNEFFKPDFVMDFTALPEDWDEKWDFLYSNSLDHSYDPTATFREWVRVVKAGGVLALGFSLESQLSSTDPSVFDKDTIMQFLDAEDSVECVSTFQESGYENFIIKKIGM